MARIRTIKPEMAQDVKLATASREARYTFVLLITQADDEGLVPGAHRQLLGLLYPHDEDVTTSTLLGWIEELIVVGAVRWRSTVDGAPILELTNWSKHQRVDNKGRSQLAGFLLPLGELPPVAESRRDPPRSAATRRLDLGPGTKDQGPSAVRVVRDDPRFAATWVKYPKRAGGNSRVDAFRQWQARVTSGVDPAELDEGTDRYLAYCTAKGWVGSDYVMQGARFFGKSEQWREPWDAPSNGALKHDDRPRVLSATEMLLT